MTATVDGQSQTIKGVAWELDGTYKQKDERQTLTFTAKLPDGYKLADNVSLPKITVIVNAKATGIKTVSAFTDCFETQEFTIGTAEWVIKTYLPTFITATVDGQENQTIDPVAWENKGTAYDESSYEVQTITYTAKLPDGYRLADDIFLPTITVITSLPPIEHGEYSISYRSWNVYLDYEYLSSLKPDRYSGDKEVQLPIPELDEWIFMGWYTINEDGSDLNLDRKIKKIEKGDSGHKTFFALWAPTIPLTYYDDTRKLHGLEPSAYCRELDTALPLPVLPETKPDHSFEGWCKNNGWFEPDWNVNWADVITEIIGINEDGYLKYLCAKWKWDKEEEVLKTISTFTSGSPNELKITGELTLADIQTISDALKALDETIKVNLDLSECIGLTVIPRTFSSCPNLEKIILPNSITEISNNAFDGCKALTTIRLPDSVTRIGQEAFSNCESLKTVGLPNYITTIEKRTFINCHALESIIIPDSVTEIGESAFYDCSALPTINIPDGITKIASAAFASCTSLQSIDIPESVTEIGYAAFNGCESLSSIKIPSKVTKIEEETFWNCRALKSVTIPDSVTEIGIQAFMTCTALESITIPDGVTEINPSTFKYCYALKTVHLPKSITKIGPSAFLRCIELESITIPDSVTEIDANAFLAAQKLSSIIVEAETPPVLGDRAFDKIDSLAKIYVPQGSVEAYKAQESEVPDGYGSTIIFGWKNYADKIQAKP